MKILLFGKDGQVGRELQHTLAPLGELIALGRRHERFDADFSEPAALAATVRAISPAVIVNAAAYTDVDRAESEPEAARSVNAVAPGVLAEAAARLQSILVHYGTDYVFDGSGTEPYDEEAPKRPLNVYGSSKLEGEELIRRSECTHAILRTSWVFAAHGRNFASTVMRRAVRRESLTVVDDQIGSPTAADWLADITARVIRDLVQDSKFAGTYHAAAAGYTSWYGYAQYLIERARALGYPVTVNMEDVRPITSSEYRTAARRPLNSRLSTQKLVQTFGVTIPSWQTGVDRMLLCMRDRSDWQS